MLHLNPWTLREKNLIWRVKSRCSSPCSPAHRPWPPHPPPLEWSRRVRRSMGWVWTLTLPKLLHTWLVWGATCWRASSSYSTNWRYPSDHGLQCKMWESQNRMYLCSHINSDFDNSTFYNSRSLWYSSSGLFPLVYLPRSQSIVLTREQPVNTKGKLWEKTKSFRQTLACWNMVKDQLAPP